MQARAVFALGLALLSAGCGGDDDSTTTFGKNCGTFNACGGDPIGAWSLEDLCYDPPLEQASIDQFGPDCADEVQSYAFHGAMSLTFDKSTLHGELDELWADESVRVTQKCLDAIVRSTGSDQSIPLAQYCPNLEAGLNQGGNDANCGFAGGACSCDLTIRAPLNSQNKTGTFAYSVMDNDLIFDAAPFVGASLAMSAGATTDDAGVSANPDAHPFCVEGDKLTLSLGLPDGPSTTWVFVRK